MTRLAGGLPKDPTQNGLHAIGRALLDDPLRRHLVLGVVDCSRITTNTETGERDATVRVLRIETVHPDDRVEAERLVRRALEFRQGDTVLPIELERDLTSWFGEGVTVDLQTGVVTVPSDTGPDDELLDDVGEAEHDARAAAVIAEAEAALEAADHGTPAARACPECGAPFPCRFHPFTTPTLSVVPDPPDDDTEELP